MTASLVLLYWLDFLLFLLPGFAIALGLANRYKNLSDYFVPIVIASSAALGYVAFWIYFGNKTAGRIFSFGCVGVSLIVAVASIARGVEMRQVLRRTAEPFFYVAAVGACYACLLFSTRDAKISAVDLPNTRFFTGVLPGDNLIPFIFAERIYDRQPVRPFCCGDWLSSDRPPLQAGVFLLQRPIRFAGDAGLHYELLSIAWQFLWICGVWVLLEAVGTPKLQIRQVLGLFVFSGFLFFNSVYVWPKLFASAFLLFAFAVLLKAMRERRQNSFHEILFAALCVSLALMTHPGTLFSLPAFAAIAIWKRVWKARYCLAGAVILLVFAIPWSAYQRFHDPPGNRLLKMHLAGVGQIDSRSTWQALKDSYSSLSIGDLIVHKATNIRTLIGPEPLSTFAVLRGPAGEERTRILQREYIWGAIGLLNAGWICLVLSLVRRKQPSVRYSLLFVVAAVANLVIWSLLLFGPGATYTTHASYADFFLISVGLIGYLLTLRRGVILVLFAATVCNLLLVWLPFSREHYALLSTAGRPLSTDHGALFVGLLLAGGLIALFGRSLWQQVSQSASANP